MRQLADRGEPRISTAWGFPSKGGIGDASSANTRPCDLGVLLLVKPGLPAAGFRMFVSRGDPYLDRQLLTIVSG